MPTISEKPNLQANTKKDFDIQRSLPHSTDAEKSILSSMFQNPVEYVMRAEELGMKPEHFYYPGHQTIFSILLEFSTNGTAIELIGLTQTLRDRGILDSVGGPSELTEIYTFSPTAAHFQAHLNLVKDKYILRSVIASCTEAITNSYDQPEEVAQLLDSIEQKILAIREGAETGETETIREQVNQVIENFQNEMAGGGAPSGFTTGYSKLDTMSNGLKAGEMLVIAARPSMGKTSLLMNIMEHIALEEKKPTMIFSCEMTSEQIVQRLLFSRSRYAITNLKKGIVPITEELKRIQKAAKEISESKIFIDDTAGISISELRAKARRKKKEEDIQVIGVDYLQLMRSHSKQAQGSREREIAEISAGLKALAKELKIPVVVLAQLNRGPENRGGTPRMSDLRESGSIEQDADMIGLLYRAAYYGETQEERDEKDGLAELNLAKNRNGETGSIPLTFIKELMRFETMAFDHETT